MTKLKPSTLSIIIMTGIVLGAVGYLLGTLVTSGSSGVQASPSARGPGAVYDTPVPVADFTLTDQTGTPFAFSSTKGKVVVMAFLFTHCGDVCPFSAIKLRLTLEQLGASAKNVELVVVDTDPERDTVPVLAAYSRELGLFDKWHMVTGPLADMQNLYKSLKITVIKESDDDVQTTVKNANDLGISLPQKDQSDSPLFGLSDAQVLEGGKIAKKYSGGYQIAHSAPFWVVDGSGRIRTSLDVSASPAQLVEAVKTYLPKS
jgi:protein SCO1/2